MKAKKSPKADLERKRPMFFQIGIAVSLCLVLFAFEWKSQPANLTTYDRGTEIDIESIPDIERTERTQEEKVQTKKNFTVLEIIENGDIDDGDFEFDIENGENIINLKDLLAKFQTDEKRIDEEEIFKIVEDEPQFSGGETARLKYLAGTLKYPVLAQQVGIQGKVYVSFIVEKDGSITDVQLVRGIGGGCDEETVRAVKEMPKWKAGKQRNKPVRVRLQMAVNWVLAK